MGLRVGLGLSNILQTLNWYPYRFHIVERLYFCVSDTTVAYFLGNIKLEIYLQLKSPISMLNLKFDKLDGVLFSMWLFSR